MVIRRLADDETKIKYKRPHQLHPGSSPGQVATSKNKN